MEIIIMPNNDNSNNNNNKNNKPSKLEQATTILTCFYEGTFSNVARNTNFFGTFRVFIQFL
jgi:hypothetical protein